MILLNGKVYKNEFKLYEWVNNMGKISTSVVLSIAVGILSFATKLVEAGNYIAGGILGVIGVVIVALTEYLREKGLVETVKQAFGK